MSRTPKYRAWHIATKRMYEVATIYFYMPTKQVELRHSEQGLAVAYTIGEEVELMQSMEQEDKHGKEIYVSDIITHPPYWDDGHTVSVVRTIHEFCGDYGKYGDFETEVEVIGNIYEHGHLLGEG